jgi:hypothetical protein
MGAVAAPVGLGLTSVGGAAGVPGVGTFIADAFQDALETASYTKLMQTGYAAGEPYGGGAMAYGQEQIKQVSKLFYFVKAALDSFGIQVTSNDKKEAENPEDVGIIEYWKQDGLTEPAPLAWASYLNNRNFYGSLITNSTRGLPDHWGACLSVIKGINNASQGSYQINPVSLVETDTEILKLWMESFASTGFMGKAVDPDREVIVFGDLALIKGYLYGAADTTQENKRINELRGSEYNIALEKAEAAQRDYDNTMTFEYRMLGHGVAITEKQLQFNIEQTQRDKMETLFASELVRPLYSYDKAFLNSRYLQTINEIVNPKITDPLIGPFGDVSYIPDEFSHLEMSFTDDERTKILENTIPIFRYNTDNPNVLDLVFKFGKLYFAELELGFSRDVDRRASAALEGILSTTAGTVKIRTIGAAINFLEAAKYSTLSSDEQTAKLASLRHNLDPELLSKYRMSNKREAFVQSLSGYFLNVLKNPNKLFVKFSQYVKGDPEFALTTFAEELYKKAMQLRIKTLPNFQISKNGAATIASTCIVLAQDSPVLSIKKPERTTLNRFFSGAYNIMGFKHSITPTGAISEFDLVKIMPSAKPTPLKTEVE